MSTKGVFMNILVGLTRRLASKLFNKDTLKLVAILGSLDFVCDFGWFGVGRWTEVYWWMTLIGVVFWAYVGAIIIESWLHTKVGEKKHDSHIH